MFEQTWAEGQKLNISHIYAKCNCTVFVLYLGSTQFGSKTKQLLF
jgi:hypothetical protein